MFNLLTLSGKINSEINRIRLDAEKMTASTLLRNKVVKSQLPVEKNIEGL